MIHRILPVGPLRCNCSIIGDETTREAVVVDPGDDIDSILRLVDSLGLTVKGIVITHAHVDHIGGSGLLRAQTGAPVYMHDDDFMLVDRISDQAAMLGMRQPEGVEIDTILRHGDRLSFADREFDVLHTPGHTQGSVSLLVGSEDLLLAGDTLFRDSIGRTDLPGGDYRQILRSIKTRLLALDDQVQVVCGHGPRTTIGRERERNFFLRGL